VSEWCGEVLLGRSAASLRQFSEVKWRVERRKEEKRGEERREKKNSEKSENVDFDS